MHKVVVRLWYDLILIIIIIVEPIHHDVSENLCPVMKC